MWSYFHFASMVFYITLVSYFFSFNMAKAAVCRENGQKVCCSGYKRNLTSGECDKCPPGSMGPDCAYNCPYPSYGEDCYMTCACSADLCDFHSGCINNTLQTNLISSRKNTAVATNIHTLTINEVKNMRTKSRNEFVFVC